MTITERDNGADLVFETATGAIRFERLVVAGGCPILQARPTGYNSTADLSEIMQRLDRTRRFGGPLPTLWDFRDHDFDAYRMSEFRSHAFILRKLPLRAGMKRAYLVNSDTGYGVLRMFQEAVGGYRLEEQDRFKVSYDRDELLAWLTESM